MLSGTASSWWREPGKGHCHPWLRLQGLRQLVTIPVCGVRFTETEYMSGALRDNQKTLLNFATVRSRD